MGVVSIANVDGRVLKNCTAQPGDDIIITKPIGTGIITTAIKRGLASQVCCHHRRCVTSPSPLFPGNHQARGEGDE